METGDIFDSIGDLFSGKNIEVERAQRAAQRSISSAVYFARSADASTKQIKQRLVELERDNALLGLVLLRLIKDFSTTGVLNPAAFAAEIREAVAAPEMAPALASLDVFRAMLELPPVKKTPLTTGKPVGARLPPQKPSPPAKRVAPVPDSATKKKSP